MSGRLHHEVVGVGSKPVLLLHGFLGQGRNLSSLAKQWSAQDPSRKIFLVDLPGHGLSRPLPPGAGLLEAGREVLAWARALDLDGCEVVGHSMGGRVALAMAKAEPRAITAITLLDIAPGPMRVDGEVDRTVAALAAAPARTGTRAEMRNALLSADAPPHLVDWLLMNLSSDGDGYDWRIDRRALGELRVRSEAEDLWPVLENTPSAPTRCIRGGKSRYVTESDARRLAAAGCEVVTIASAGHYLHVDAPDELLAILRTDFSEAGR